MITVTTRLQLKQQLQLHRDQQKSIGLVPTMGNLHAGHMSLLAAAVAQCDVAVATIFVNPLQFGPGEDLAAYPRTLDQDAAQLEGGGCAVLFAPEVTEIYEHGLEVHTKVCVPQLTEEFCGASRPGHFDGVTTVVAKLFNLVRPDTAFFGLKDYQQFLVIKKMVADLALGIDIVGVETVREDSGLALSSRNNYLSDEEKKLATRLYSVLLSTASAIKEGERDFAQLERGAAQQLGSSNMLLDYFAIRDAESLQMPQQDSSTLVVLGAVRIGPSRLIDNIRVHLST